MPRSWTLSRRSSLFSPSLPLLAGGERRAAALCGPAGPLLYLRNKKHPGNRLVTEPRPTPPPNDPLAEPLPCPHSTTQNCRNGKIVSTSCSKPSSTTSPDSPPISEDYKTWRGISSQIWGKPQRLPAETTKIETAFRHAGWETTRRRILEALRSIDAPRNRIESFCNCGADAWILRHRDTAGRYKIAANTCHDRFCLPCSHTRGATVTANILDYTEGKRLKLITLTIRHNAQPLRDQIDHLYKSFKKLRNDPVWKGAVAGGVAVLEVHHTGHANGWHPHLHVLAECSYIPQRDLSAAWHYITKDSFVVHIKQVTGNAHAARYITKYLSKPVTAQVARCPQRLQEAIVALKSRRFLLTFAGWRDAKFTAIADDGDDWVIVGPLTDAIRAANAGDGNAREMLRACLRQQPWHASARPPPHATLIANTPEIISQLQPPTGPTLPLPF